VLVSSLVSTLEGATFRFCDVARRGKTLRRSDLCHPLPRAVTARWGTARRAPQAALA